MRERGLFDLEEPSPSAGGAADENAEGRGAPLAERMRPRTLDEVVGQEAVVGPGGFLRRAIADDRVPSLVFWGPPGTGKTTLARIIARETSAHFVPFSAVTSGIKEIKEVMADAARLRRARGSRTLLFVDEIHRFNRAQQDAFLPFVERGDIVLVGATTENPSFELNAALLSRCRVVVLEPLGESALRLLVERALSVSPSPAGIDAARGVSDQGVSLTAEAIDALVGVANGDARRALNLLELVVADARGAGRSTASPEEVRSVAQRKTLLYDKSGEEHYNLISALHKSLRESDPDAALYWLTRMLRSGEDPGYLARRMVRFASEDVGLADPAALPQALAGWQAYDRLGSPEGEIHLAQVCLYLALAPKSVATYRALGAAQRAVEEKPAEPVPAVIRNAVTGLMRNQGYGKGYVYAPDTDDGVAGLDCLPEALRGSTFYEPAGEGFEGELRQRLERLRDLRARHRASKS